MHHKIIHFHIGSINGDLLCIHIDIMDDIYVEKNEYFSLHIKLVDLNVWVIGSLYVDIHIYDDDGIIII